MISRRHVVLAGASMFSPAVLRGVSEAQPPQGFAAARKAVGKRACPKCDDRGQVQANIGGGIVDKPHVEGIPDVAWVQQGYVLCPDCLGESREFRTACSLVKDGVLPVTKLARKRIEAHKAAGTFKELEAKAKGERELLSSFTLFSTRGRNTGGSGSQFLANLAAHYRSATMTRGVVRALVVRWGSKAAGSAVRMTESSVLLVDKAHLITAQDLLKAAAASMDVKYPEPCGFPPLFNSLPTFKNNVIPDTFNLQVLG